MKRSYTWLGAVALLAGGLWIANRSSIERPPNIVIVVLDTLRPDHLGLYGYERDTSPLLDARADEFFVFQNAQTVAPWTAPSLVSIMTGLYPDVHQVRAFPYPGRMGAGATTLAEILKRYGFATGAFTEGGFAKGIFGLDQGFDVYPTNEGDDVSHGSNRTYPSRIKGNFDRLLPWIEARGTDEPFFAFFQTYEPHSPFRAPEEYIQYFNPDYDEDADHALVEATINAWNVDRTTPSNEGYRAMQRHILHCEYGNMPVIELPQLLIETSVEAGIPLEMFVDDAEYLQWAHDVYDAEIRFTDSQLERLWEALEANGQADNTLVVIVSDHGEGLGQHGVMGHGGVLHDDVLRVVFMLRPVGDSFTPRRVNDLVSLVDVVPTVLELMDLNSGNSRFQGESAVPLMRGESRPDKATFTHAVSRMPIRHSARQGQWRFILHRVTREEELYNLAEDPGELTNILDQHPQQASHMRRLLRDQLDFDRALRATLDVPLEESELDAQTQAELNGLGYFGSEND